MAVVWLDEATPEQRADETVVLEAIRHYGEQLQYASDELRRNRAVVLAAVAQDGESLLFADEELRGDREIVLRAVENRWTALRFVAQPMKASMEVLQLAMSQNGHALQYAPSEVRADRFAVLMAVQQHPRALEYAAAPLRADRQLLVEADVRTPGTVQSLVCDRWCLPYPYGSSCRRVAESDYFWAPVCKAILAAANIVPSPDHYWPRCAKQIVELIALEADVLRDLSGPLVAARQRLAAAKCFTHAGSWIVEDGIAAQLRDDCTAFIGFEALDRPQPRPLPRLHVARRSFEQASHNGPLPQSHEAWMEKGLETRPELVALLEQGSRDVT
eukprot:SAG31_NODE_524_length_14529_cov_23.084130_7_plen_330_part_00